MAGAGYKLFNTGDVLTAAQVNTYLQEQAVMRFANSTARTTALSGVLAEGMVSYLDDTNAVEVYNGSAWVSIGSSGDITGVTAGTGISGGGTSGDVTITNSMATAIDAKGDLIVGTGADTFARLAVGGTNGHILKVNSSTSTGLEWGAAASGSTFAGCRAFDSGTQNISNTTETDITWNSETFDTDGYHSTSSNTERMTIPAGKAGYYLVQTVIRYTTNTSGKTEIYLVKTSGVTDTQFALSTAPAASDSGQLASGIVYLAESDYVRVKVYQNSGGTVTINKASANSYFSISYLGA